MKLALGVLLSWILFAVAVSIWGVWESGDWSYPLTFALPSIAKMAAWSSLLVAVAGALKRWKIGLALYAAMPLACLALAGGYVLTGANPWRPLPGYSPGVVSRFAARHPDLSISETGIDTVTIGDGAHEAALTRAEITDAAVKFEACAEAISDLAGLPRLSKLACRFALRIEQPAGKRRLYVLHAADSTAQEILAYYRGWATQMGGQAADSGLNAVSLSAGARQWTVSVRPGASAREQVVTVSVPD